MNYPSWELFSLLDHVGGNLFIKVIFWHPKTEAAGIPFKVLTKIKPISLSEDREVTMQVCTEVSLKVMSGVIIVSSSFWLYSLKLGRMSGKLKRKTKQKNWITSLCFLWSIPQVPLFWHQQWKEKSRFLLEMLFPLMWHMEMWIVLPVVWVKENQSQNMSSSWCKHQCGIRLGCIWMWKSLCE